MGGRGGKVVALVGAAVAIPAPVAMMEWTSGGGLGGLALKVPLSFPLLHSLTLVHLREEGEVQILGGDGQSWESSRRRCLLLLLSLYAIYPPSHSYNTQKRFQGACGTEEEREAQ